MIQEIIQLDGMEILIPYKAETEESARLRDIKFKCKMAEKRENKKFRTVIGRMGRMLGLL